MAARGEVPHANRSNRDQTTRKRQVTLRKEPVKK